MYLTDARLDWADTYDTRKCIIIYLFSTYFTVTFKSEIFIVNTLTLLIRYTFLIADFITLDPYFGNFGKVFHPSSFVGFHHSSRDLNHNRSMLIFSIIICFIPFVLYLILLFTLVHYVFTHTQ